MTFLKTIKQPTTNLNTLRRALCGITLAGIAACGGSDPAPASGNSSVGEGTFKITVIDEETRAPVSGLSVSVYEADNKTIAQTKSTGADGVADFGSIVATGASGVSSKAGANGHLTITIVAELDNTIDIGTLYDIQSGSYTILQRKQAPESGCNVVGHIDRAVFTGLGDSHFAHLTPIASGRILTPDSTVPPGFPGGFVADGNVTIRDVDVCAEHLQSDGKLSLVVLGVNEQNDPVSQVAMYDIEVSMALDLQSDVSSQPASRNWTTNASDRLSLLGVFGVRRGVQYLLNSGANTAQAAAGSIVFPDQLSMDGYTTLASSQSPGPDGSLGCTRSRWFEQLPENLSFELPAFGASEFTFDAATRTVTGQATGPLNAISLSIEQAGPKPIEWSLSAPGSYAQAGMSLPIVDLPPGYEAITQIDPATVEVSLINLPEFASYDEFVRATTVTSDRLRPFDDPRMASADNCYYSLR